MILEREQGGEREKKRERERERERDVDVREKHQLVASHMRPDQGSNPQPFSVPTEPPGQGSSNQVMLQKPILHQATNK